MVCPSIICTFTNSMMYAFDSGMDSLADAVGEQMETWFEEVFESSGGDEFVCDNGQEIPTHWVNDDYDDCEDGSDEGVTGEVGYDFYCDNGNVIPAHYADDGWDDCGDNSDEDTDTDDDGIGDGADTDDDGDGVEDEEESGEE